MPRELLEHFHLAGHRNGEAVRLAPTPASILPEIMLQVALGEGVLW